MNHMPSVMSHAFSKVPQATIPRSSFNRSHGYKTTFDAGWLVPIFVDEALPGDTFNLKLHALVRLATPLKPVMDNMYLETFFFAVPIRLIWDNFKKFNGEQVNPGDSTDFVVPTMTSTAGTGYAIGSLHDYFGIPTGVPGLVHSSLFHRAHNLIFNEWFRDENLINSVVVDKDDGPDSPTDYVLLRRGKRHDYFTSCLPWPQKGTSVSLPLGTSAPVSRVSSAGAWGVYQAGTQTLSGAQTTLKTEVGSHMAVTGDAFQVSLDPAGGLIADLSTATAATINQLRQAFQIQKLYERDARGGTRYTEIVRSHFGVTSPDSRLQRPEYLGGGSTRINITPVSTTAVRAAGDSNDRFVGDLAGYGVGNVSGHGFTKSFTEHCVLIGFANVRADLTYQQGLERMWSRSTRWDFYWPALSQIGEQAVLNKELYAQGTANPTQDAAVFGYQERYAEYRYKPSRITGLFRSTASGTLDLWHLSQKFTALPTLNSTFIQDDPPIDRVIAVPSQPHFIYDSYIELKTARPMPIYGVPGMIDHF